MKLSILIVNWNTRDLVNKCVDSILKNAPNFEYEVILVDNNSRDRSYEFLKRNFTEKANIKILAAGRNLGFAQANNFAYQNCRGEYVLMLNPDTEVSSGSLQKLVEFLDSKPDVGIVGPKILNFDRTIQPSVRRFPDSWSSFLIFSGLHRIFRPRFYLMDDFNYELSSEVDQVMGAALLTRRRIIERHGFLDEHFWLWYEEVDFCKRVKGAGWKVNFFPGSTIFHHGASSFSQMRVYERKKVAADSVRYYFKKNGNGLQRAFIAFFMPPLLLLSRILSFFKTQNSLRGWFRPKEPEKRPHSIFVASLAVFFLAEAASLFGHTIPAVTLPFLAIIGLVTFLLGIYRAEWGIYVFFGELFVGGRGHLLEYELGGFSISIRLIIFTAIFLAWILKDVPKWKPLPKSYWLLLGAIAIGVINGYVHENGFRNIFLDANGYLYLLIFPAVLRAVRKRDIFENIFRILGAAIAVIGLKTFTLFVWFTYNWEGVSTLYNWVISQEIGEITGLIGGIPRIFMQSQFYALMGLFIFGLSSPKSWKLVSAALFTVIVGFSRSFWLGAGAGAVFATTALLTVLKVKYREIFRFGFSIILIAMIEIAGLYLISNLGGQHFGQAVTSRIENPQQDAAGSARLMLLPPLWERIKQSPILGKGFGAEVSYSSYLPDKVSPENPDGEITSFAFEWGYLDVVLKIGFLGALVYLFFIARVFRQGWKKIKYQKSNIKNLGVLSGLVALLVLNITTPYLNHPLGIGYLILSFVAFRDYEQTAG